MIILRWREVRPAALRWIGPSSSMAAPQRAAGPGAIAAVIGPPGPAGPAGSKGDAGPPGPKGDAGDQGAQGEKGDRGEAFKVNAAGTLSERSAYDGEAPEFSYLATDTGLIYFRLAEGDWSVGVPFGKGDKGDKGDPGDEGPQGPPGADGAAGAPGSDGSDATVTEAAVLAALNFTPEDKAAKGQANGYAGLGADGKVPAGQLPAPPTVPTFATVAEVWAGTATDKIIPPKVLNDAMIPTTLAIAAGVVSPDCHNGINFDIASINANITIANLANKAGKGGRSGSITGKNDATAGRTVSLGTDWKKIGTTAFPPAANAMWKMVYNIDSNGVNYSVMVLAA